MNVPSGYIALDLIGFTDRGDYSSSANYVKNDLVHSGGRVWLCRVDDTTNITPAVGANWKIWIDEAAYLSGLADTTITSPIDGQVLRYDIATNKWVNASVDSSPTQSSTNLVQSGGVYTQLANKANTSDLATVATTGDYSDLSGKPNLATVATSGSYNDLSNKPSLAAVATSGSYNDLSNKPTLGTAAAKDSTNAVTQSSTDLVESGAVYSEVNTVKQALTTETQKLEDCAVNGIESARKVFTLTYPQTSIPANSAGTIACDNWGSIPSNYTPVGICTMLTGNALMTFRNVDLTNYGTVSIYNHSAAANDAVPVVKIYCIDKSVLAGFFSVTP